MSRIQNLSWDELSPQEKAQAQESYLCIKENEEKRGRNEVTDEHPEPINPDGVKLCKFKREIFESGKTYLYIHVII